MGNSKSTDQSSSGRVGTVGTVVSGKRDLMEMILKVPVAESELILPISQPSSLNLDKDQDQGSTELQCLQQLRDLLDEITKLSNEIHQAYLSQRVAYTKEDTTNASDRITELTSQMILKSRSFMKDLSEFKNGPFDQRFRNEHGAYLSKKFQSIYQDFKNMAETNQQKYITAVSGIEMQQLHEIKDRHQEIVQLEKQIHELHELFLDMAVLVDSQASAIDRVEKNTESTHVKIAVAQVELRQAHSEQRSARKKRVCIGFWTLILVGIIVLIIMLV